MVKIIMLVSTLAGSFFLVTIFAMTKLLLMTNDGYPFQVTESDLALPRLLGTISFFLGIFSLIAMISLAGWTKSIEWANIHRTWDADIHPDIAYDDVDGESTAECLFAGKSG